MSEHRSAPVNPVVERLAAYAWRLAIIAVVGVAILWLLGAVWIAVLPVVVAAFLTRILIGPTDWLRARRFRPALASATVLLGFLLLVVAALGLVGYSAGKQSTNIGPAVTEALNDIEDWLVTDGPGDMTRADIQDFREGVSRAAGNWIRDSGGTLVSGAVVVFQVVMGIVLGLIITFFALKDGERFLTWVLSLVPERRRRRSRRLASKAWATLGGYLRGAALLGLLEGVVIGATVALVGAQLAAPIGLITFLLAFIPFAGAIIAGAVAVLVALSTAGPGAAVIVLVVTVVVQQLDGDLLAPVIYGRQLELHPVAVLLAITAGGSLFGVAGAFLAVPVTAVVVNVVAENRRAERELAAAATEPPDTPGPEDDGASDGASDGLDIGASGHPEPPD